MSNVEWSVSKGDDNLVYPQWEEPMENVLKSVHPLIRPAAEVAVAIGIVMITTGVLVVYYRLTWSLYFKVGAWALKLWLSMFF
jgi:hypothetical protein